jgi:hypothetical protein
MTEIGRDRAAIGGAGLTSSIVPSPATPDHHSAGATLPHVSETVGVQWSPNDC